MKVSLLLLLTLSVFQLGAQNPNRPMPLGAVSYEFEVLDSSFNNYAYSFSYIPRSPEPYYLTGILDSVGYLQWFTWSNQIILDLKYNSQISNFTCQYAGNNRTYRRLNQQMECIDSLAPTNGDGQDIHEYLIDQNEHTYIIGVNDTLMDLSAYTFNGSQGLSNQQVKTNTILEYDENKNLVFYWNSGDHIHPSEFYNNFSYDSTYFDYLHLNSIDIDHDGNLLISARHTSTIYKISKTNGSIIWRLGGNNSDFTFPNDNGFSGQHDFRYLGNNLYSMYDNGNHTSTPKQSRAVEFELDTINWTATRVWRYKHTPKVYGPAMGNNDLTSNGDNLVNWGRIYYPEPAFSLVGANGNNQANMYFLDSVMSYRSHPLEMDFNFPRPEILCDHINGQIVLTCVNSDSCWWSTGDTTQSIVVTTPGEYMCWNPYGIGWLGSKVFKLNDLSNPCGVNSLEENNMEIGEIMLIYSLSGKTINQPSLPGLYIVRYESGAFEKRWWDGLSWN